MDPFSVFQMVGAAVSLSEVVVKSLMKLNSIRTRYHKCPLLLSTMIGQLYTVQSALDQLSAWNRPEQAQGPRYQQLGMHIGNSLDSFSTLVLALHQQLGRFEVKEPVEMTSKQKFKFLWNEKDMTEYSILLDRQVNALNLLLQALECSSWSQQDALVSQPDNQEVLRVAQDCSSSILGLDSDSISIASEGTELISIRFDFDAVVLGSRVYQLAERSHLKQAIRGLRTGPLKTVLTERKPSSPDPVSDVLSTKDGNNESQYSARPVPGSVYWQLRSTLTGQWWKGQQIPKMETGNLVPLEPNPGIQRVLIDGAPNSGKSALLRSMVLDRKGFSGRFQTLHTEAIRDNLINGRRKILEHMERSSIPSSYAYFSLNAKRIMAPGYIPSDQDLIYSSIKTLGMRETRLEFNNTTYTVFDIGEVRSERNKWIHGVGHIDTVVFTIDVTSNAKVLVEDGAGNQLQEGLEILMNLFNSRWFDDSNFILPFTKIDLLGERLRVAPPKELLRSAEKGLEFLEVKLEHASENQILDLLERRFMGVITSQDRRRRVRVLRSSLGDVAACNPARDIFEMLDELARAKALSVTAT
ncbi:guanine nucleotide-binding protein subunit alpha [Apiospora kogelbergensis]|uniref:Guanine nucleotide-binding protein subunit alpha n=1 Tax=Apiospora kogelbergensis TaxID=1337665 RepID=A0AAW0Q7N2_9PEZI